MIELGIMYNVAVLYFVVGAIISGLVVFVMLSVDIPENDGDYDLVQFAVKNDSATMFKVFCFIMCLYPVLILSPLFNRNKK
jgi:uncharacterized membrane protein YgaE (UPF0421/DUF939 family)